MYSSGSRGTSCVLGLKPSWCAQGVNALGCTHSNHSHSPPFDMHCPELGTRSDCTPPPQPVPTPSQGRSVSHFYTVCPITTRTDHTCYTICHTCYTICHPCYTVCPNNRTWPRRLPSSAWCSTARMGWITLPWVSWSCSVPVRDNTAPMNRSEL